MSRSKNLLWVLPLLALVLTCMTPAIAPAVHAQEADNSQSSTAYPGALPVPGQKPMPTEDNPQGSSPNTPPSNVSEQEKRRAGQETGQDAPDVKTAENRGAALANKLRDRGEELLAKLRKERRATTKELRQKACEVRREGLLRKSNNMVAVAQDTQRRIDNILAKITAYQKRKNLQVDNYEVLVALATAAQSTARSSVATLATLKPPLQCGNDTAAHDVAVFRSAAVQAKTDLESYRQTVKAVLRAVIKADGQSPMSTDGQL